MNPRLAVATPIRAAELMSASVSLGYAEMIARMHRTIPCEILDGSITFSADIVRGRNRIAAKILRDLPQITHVLWLDDDNWCDDHAIVPEMIALDVDVVSAPYTNKRQPMRWIHQNLTPPAQAVGALLEVAGVGFGFTLTTTDALRKLSQATRIYTDHPLPHKVPNLFGHLYYHPAQERGDVVPDGEQALLSEDFSFCLRWRRLGGKVYIYAKSGIIHHAGGHDWTAKEMSGGVVEQSQR